MEIIKANNISKTFKKQIVLDDLSFYLKENESIAIIGRNGSGKTVFSKILTNLIKQDSGEIEYNMEGGVFDISMQFQSLNLPEELKVYEILKIYELEFANLDAKNTITKLSEVFEIESFLKKRISKLSGGQKQRVNLLLSLIKKPQVLILDEFITGLDVLSAEKIIKYLEVLKKEEKTSLVIITHQPDEIKRLTDRIIKLENGKFTSEFKTSDVDKKYKGDFKKFLMEEIHE